MCPRILDLLEVPHPEHVMLLNRVDGRWSRAKLAPRQRALSANQRTTPLLLLQAGRVSRLDSSQLQSTVPWSCIRQTIDACGRPGFGQSLIQSRGRLQRDGRAAVNWQGCKSDPSTRHVYTLLREKKKALRGRARLRRSVGRLVGRGCLRGVMGARGHSQHARWNACLASPLFSANLAAAHPHDAHTGRRFL